MKRFASSAVGLRNLPICCIILLLSSVLATAQHESVLYAFGTNANDGSLPQGGLIADAAGNLYGMTNSGGPSNAGTVYELSPPAPGSPWTETVLYAFGGDDGDGPYGSLVFDSMGNLYGTTNAGGDQLCLCGMVFELTPPTAPGGSWTETMIYGFKGGNDGSGPFAGVVLDKAGNLYGTTGLGGVVEACGGSGCGTVFELSPPTTPGGSWTETVLYSFTDGNDGGVPFAPVTLDEVGNVYGTTHLGGSQNCGFGCGTVFELTPSGSGTWTEILLHSFSSIRNDGSDPEFGGLFLDKSGALIGTTSQGGAGGHNLGTVFGLRPSSGGKWAYEVLYSFHGNDGLEPQGGVISVGGVLYGTTAQGGSHGAGTAFRLARMTGGAWKETGLYSFSDGSDGAIPRAGLVLHDSALYGTTAQGGGSTGGGTVFEIAP
jgi:uncharacterized repeat protein (TIGR03803 family)